MSAGCSSELLELEPVTLGTLELVNLAKTTICKVLQIYKKDKKNGTAK